LRTPGKLETEGMMRDDEARPAGETVGRGSRLLVGREDLVVGPCDVGRGVFAARRFLPGETILVFRGPRVDRSDPVHHTPAGANLLQTGPRTYIDPEPPGVFVNHSCRPNAGVGRERRLFALVEILPGQEIRFDYSTTMDEDLWTMECLCGEAGCRGRVTDFRLLPLEVRQTAIARGAVPGFIARRYGGIMRSGRQAS
jgi:hypothetical protein